MWQMTGTQGLYRQALEQIANTVSVRRELSRLAAKEDPTKHNIATAHCYGQVDRLVKDVLSDLVQILDNQSEGVYDHTKEYWMLVPEESKDD